MEGGDWAREFLAVSLGERVPSEVVELFEVARGAMLYGWFFYPLYRLGEEQLYRVIEAAAKLRYRELDGPKARPSYEHAIAMQVERGAIAPGEEFRWDAARKLRNLSSHPEQAVVTTPGSVLGTLTLCAEDINRLFAAKT